MLPFLVPVFAAAFAGLVLAGAFRDLVSFTIPNWISLAIVALFPLAALSSGLSLPAAGAHLAVGAAVLVASMAMFAFRWIGGGDAKLFAAAALWMGWPAVVDFVLGTAITGGVLAMALLSLRSTLVRPTVLLGPAWLVKLSEPGGAAPYGVAIAVGGLIALPQSPLLSGLAL